MKMKIIHIALLLLICASTARAGYAGAEPFSFLLLDSNARGVALGGAYTALASDANALQYNPAGLGKVTRPQATFMHNQYFQDITQDYLAWASPSGWGAMASYLDFGGATETTISNPTGSAALGDTNLTALVGAVGYGRNLGGNFSMGAGVKFIKETVAGTSGHGLAMDFGALYARGGLRLGASIQNIGQSVRFQQDSEAMPLNLRGGAAYGFSFKALPVILAMDLSKTAHDAAALSAGAEVVVAKKFPVRLGYNGNSDDGSGIAAGMGYVFMNMNFDYAFAPFKDLGATHRFSVTYMWGEPR